VVGPTTFTRRAGAVRTEVLTFPGDPSADYVLDIVASAEPGSHEDVTLNGVPIAMAGHQESDAPRHLRQPVVLLSSNTLAVRVRGKPGNEVTVQVVGGVKTLGAAGGNVRSPGGLYSLVIPPGALNQPVEIGIATLVPPALDPAELTLATPIIALSPDGLQFDAEVELRIAYDAQITVPSDLTAVQYLEADNLLAWHASTLDATAGVVSLPLLHFSNYALVQVGKLTPRAAAYGYRMLGCPPLLGAGGSCVEAHADFGSAFEQWITPAQFVGVTLQRASGAGHIDVVYGTWSASYSDVLPVLAGWSTQTSRRVIVVNSATQWWTMERTTATQTGVASLERAVSHAVGHHLGLPHLGSGAVMGALQPSVPIPVACTDLSALGTLYSVPGLGSRCVAGLAAFPFTTIQYVESYTVPFVRAVDALGLSVRGVPVFLDVTGGGGSTLGTWALTGPTGTASRAWRLGSTPGLFNTLQMVVPNVAAVGFGVTTLALGSLPAPVQLSPPDRAVFSQVPRTTTLSWDAVPGASFYEVEVESCVTWPMPAFWTCTPALGGPMGFQFPTSLVWTHVGAQPGRWHVRARTSSGIPGAWSPWRHFLFL
jgi:hypothetical protein